MLNPKSLWRATLYKILKWWKGTRASNSSRKFLINTIHTLIQFKPLARRRNVEAIYRRKAQRKIQVHDQTRLFSSLVISETIIQQLKHHQFKTISIRPSIISEKNKRNYASISDAHNKSLWTSLNSQIKSTKVNQLIVWCRIGKIKTNKTVLSKETPPTCLITQPSSKNTKVRYALWLPKIQLKKTLNLLGRDLSRDWSSLHRLKTSVELIQSPIDPQVIITGLDIDWQMKKESQDRASSSNCD